MPVHDIMLRMLHNLLEYVYWDISVQKTMAPMIMKLSLEAFIYNLKDRQQSWGAIFAFH